MPLYTDFAKAKAAGVFGNATRAGINKESIGYRMNTARRAQANGDPAAEHRSLLSALDVHKTWGALWGEYGFSEQGDTLAQVTARIALLEQAHDLPWTYDFQGRGGKPTTSCIGRKTAEQLADLFEAHGISPYSIIPHAAQPVNWNDHSDKVWTTIPEIVALVANVEGLWQSDVMEVQSERLKAKLRAERLASYERVADPAIRSYLLARLDDHGMCELAPVPELLASLAKLAKSDRRTTHKGQKVGPIPYAPVDGCKAKLVCKAALSFRSTQESYADYSEYAIPVVVEAGVDLEVCRHNLGLFADAMRTHTGFAGSGSTWSLGLVETPDGVFALLGGRHSIAD